MWMGVRVQEAGPGLFSNTEYKGVRYYENQNAVCAFSNR